jgi:HEAT repeat protein
MTAYYYDSQVLPAALDALGEIGPAAQEAVPALTAMAQDPNPAIAKLAAKALRQVEGEKEPSSKGQRP